MRCTTRFLKAKNAQRDEAQLRDVMNLIMSILAMHISCPRDLGIGAPWRFGCYAMKTLDMGY